MTLKSVLVSLAQLIGTMQNIIYAMYGVQTPTTTTKKKKKTLKFVPKKKHFKMLCL